MKRNVGRKWEEMGPGHVRGSLLSIIRADRHTQGHAAEDEERSVYGITFPEPGRRPMQAGVYDSGDINMHKPPS